MNDPNNDTTTDSPIPDAPAKRGPKPGQAAQQKAELDALRARTHELENLITTLTQAFPGLASGSGVETLTREIFVRSMVNVIADADKDGFIKFEDPADDPEVRAFFTTTSRAVRNAALIAAHTFYADPATE